MSQNDFNIADANGATVLADLNAALQALASQSSGSSTPSTTYPAQPWFDNSTGLLKFRNAANNAWVTFGPIGDSTKFGAYVNNSLAYDISASLVHTFAGTAALKIPVGTTAQRPTAVQGMIRYNTTTSSFEIYDGSAWTVFGLPADGSLGYVKLASAAIASLADLIAGTASKLVDADKFKSYMDTYIFAKGQTWQDVLSSRSLGTTYTNNTGRPIQVIITQGGNSGAFVINSLTVQTAATNTSSYRSFLSAVIPDGSSYSLTGGNSPIAWVELR